MIEIRSYRRVFDLERRIYSIDRLRLNPTGVPVRGVVYLLVAIWFALLLSAAPIIGGLARAIPWYLRDLAAPGGLAAVLAVVRIDGRAFHLAAWARLRMRVMPRRLCRLQPPSTVGARWAPPELLILPDGSDSRLRRLRYSGPGAVLVLVEHCRSGALERKGIGLASGSAALRLWGHGGQRPLTSGQVILLEKDARVVVSPTGSRSKR